MCLSNEKKFALTTRDAALEQRENYTIFGLNRRKYEAKLLQKYQNSSRDLIFVSIRETGRGKEEERERERNREKKFAILAERNLKFEIFEGIISR